MRKRLVLADSSVWIHFLRTGDPHPSALILQTLLRQDLIATTWLVRLELLSGAPTEDAYRILDADLAALRQLALTHALFQEASLLRWQLQRKGIIVPVVDSLIAACALHYDCALLHDDRHFRLIARHAPVRLYPLRVVRPS